MPIYARRAALAAPMAALIMLTALQPAHAYLNDKRPQPTVTASPGVKLSFERPGVQTAPAPPTPEQLMFASTNPTKLGGPLAHLVPTSSYGYRTSPITGMPGEMHTGQDYGAPCGTEVLSSAAGTVVFSGWHPNGGGNRVEVQHANGLTTTYNHLAASAVSPGQSVERGQIIAQVGSTGASTGCHLHFEVMVNGLLTEPVSWLS